jgi:hypothetical protein
VFFKAENHIAAAAAHNTGILLLQTCSQTPTYNRCQSTRVTLAGILPSRSHLWDNQLEHQAERPEDWPELNDYVTFKHMIVYVFYFNFFNIYICMLYFSIDAEKYSKLRNIIRILKILKYVKEHLLCILLSFFSCIYYI